MMLSAGSSEIPSVTVTCIRVLLEMGYFLTDRLVTVLVTVSNCEEIGGSKRPVTNIA